MAKAEDEVSLEALILRMAAIIRDNNYSIGR